MYTETSSAEVLTLELSGLYERRKFVLVNSYQNASRKFPFHKSVLHTQNNNYMPF